jgi:CRISPR-associated protein Cmr4
LFLEEFCFSVKRAELGALIGWLSRFGGGATFAEQLKNQLAIVSDDMFHHLATYATPVTPHIALDSSTKVVKSGALWYEETLPPETVLYVPLAAHPSRRPSGAGRRSAEWVLQQTLSLFPQNRPYVQIGGNETVGMGWCRVCTVASSLQET